MKEAVGIWVLRFPAPDRTEALLVRRATEPYCGEWFTVDGQLDPGESPRSAAVRELAEETSLAPRLLLEDAATPSRIETVRGAVWLHGFFAFVAPESRPMLNTEHSEFRWLATEHAKRLVPLASQRGALQRATERIHARSEEGLLEATGAEKIEHLGGNLRDHLERTAGLLAEFGSRPALCTAGLLHAAYGTEGFARSLLPLSDRPLLSTLVGEEVERLVYLYGACDRGHFYASLLDGQANYRDRFEESELSLTTLEVRDLMELTFANELDLARQDERFRRQHEAVLSPLFRACRGWVSERAYACFLHTYETG